MDDGYIEYLGPAECWSLLIGQPVGRLGVLVDSAPEIYPVNYRVDGETILFRTEDGAKLHGLRRSPMVCFEADGIDVHDETGWSVLVKGRAEEIIDIDVIESTDRVPIRYWAIGTKPYVIRIHAAEVTGRRLCRIPTSVRQL